MFFNNLHMSSLIEGSYKSDRMSRRSASISPLLVKQPLVWAPAAVKCSSTPNILKFYHQTRLVMQQSCVIQNDYIFHTSSNMLSHHLCCPNVEKTQNNCTRLLLKMGGTNFLFCFFFTKSHAFSSAVIRMRTVSVFDCRSFLTQQTSFCFNGNSRCVCVWSCPWHQMVQSQCYITLYQLWSHHFWILLCISFSQRLIIYIVHIANI